MLITEMNAITIADDLVEFLENHPSHSACFHSVFPHAVNLLIGEEELITLTNQDDIMPMGLIVDSSVSFTQHLKIGEKVVLNIDRFAAANGVFIVTLRDAEIWETQPLISLAPRPGDEIARINLQLVRWVVRQPALGLLPLLPRLTNQPAYLNPMNDNLYSRYVADDLEAFTAAIGTSDWEDALNIADRLVGFGMGSTPACDDFLAAYLVVFKTALVLDPQRFSWVREFNKAIANKAKNRTTLISAIMLRHAADGKIGRSYQRLIQTCMFNIKSDLAHLAGQVMQHGATSGGDFLLGLVCALNWYRNNATDFKKEGERAWVESISMKPVPMV